MNHLCKRSFSLIMAILMVLSLIPANPVHVHAEEAATIAEATVGFHVTTEKGLTFDYASVGSNSGYSLDKTDKVAIRLGANGYANVKIGEGTRNQLLADDNKVTVKLEVLTNYTSYFQFKYVDTEGGVKTLTTPQYTKSGASDSIIVVYELTDAGFYGTINGDGEAFGIAQTGKNYAYVRSIEVTPGHCAHEVTSTDCATVAKTCGKCGVTEYKLSGHAYKAVPAQAPTCTEIGWHDHYYCAVCDKYFDTDKNEVAKEKVFRSALGHEAKDTWTQSETHHWKDCVNGCGLKDQENKHSGPWSSVEGEDKHTATCTVCGYILIEDHDWVPGETVAPTANAQGYTEYSCSVCKTTKQDNFVEALTEVKVSTLEELRTALADASNNLPIVVTQTIVIPADADVTLDLNGKIVNAGWDDEAAEKHIYVIDNKGTLTITGNGEINTRGIFNYGTLTLENGTINAIDGNGGYGVRNYAGSFIMNGGTIATTLEDDHKVDKGGYDATTVRVDEGATFEMNSGTINNICDYTFAIDNYGTATIKGGTITSVHTTVSSYGTLNIEGGEFTCNGLEGVTAHVILTWDGGTTTITGGTFDGKDNYNGFNVDASEGAKVEIKDGTFLPVHSGSLYGEGMIVVSGGTFFDEIPENRFAEGFELEKNADGTYGVVVDPAYGKVAKVGETYYATLAEAVAAAQNGDEIILLADVNEAVTISGKQITLDLNDQKISGGNTDAVAVMNGANVTIKNGTLETHGTNCGGVWVKNATALIEGCTINGLSEVEPSAVYSSNGATVTIKDSVLTAKDNGTENVWALVLMSANVTVENCVLNGYHAASANGSDDYDQGNLTIVSGEFNGLVYWPAQGKLTINGGQIDEILIKSGSMEITGGQIGKVEIENVAEGGYEAIENVTITGGTIGTVELSAGASMTAPAGLTVTTADGYKVVYADGVYTSVACVYVAQVGEKKFESMTEALAVLQANGGTLELLADASINASVVVLQDTVINGNGKTITYTGSARAIDVPANADAKVNVTIENLTVDCTASYCQRGINYNDYGALTLNNVTIKGTNVTYALNLPGSSDNCVVTITDSSLTGCIALNVWGENSQITATNSVFTSVDNSTAEGYVAISLNNDGQGNAATGSVVAINGGQIIAKDEKGNASTAVRVETAATVNVSPETEVVGKTVREVVIVTYEGSSDFYSFESLQKAINKAIESNGKVVLIDNITLTETVVVNGAVVIDLNGHKVTSTAKKAFEVYANATIKNGTIEAAQRCVDTRKAVELTLTDVTLIADKYTTHGNPQPLTIGGSENGTKVTMTNVTISAAAGYGIITFVETELTATDSTIGGYNALYVKPGSEGSEFNFTDCDLTGSIGNDVEGNSFSTIAVRADDVTVNVDADSTVSANGNYYWAISLDSKYTDENGITGANITVAGAINGKVLTSADVDNNTITVKAEYADALKAAGYAVEVENGMATAVAAVARIGDVNYATLQDAENAAEDGDTIVLTDDIVLDEMVTFFNAAGERMVTLDMNGKTITLSGNWNNTQNKSAFWVCDGLKITGNGTINAAPAGEAWAYAIIVGHRTAGTTDGYVGTLVIENGTFYSDDASVVSVTNGSVTINGGTFDAAGDMDLNCIDDMYAASKASITVNGGTFVGFNPADNAVEGAGTNFVAEGYAALPDLNGNYVVGEKPTATVNNLGVQTIPAGDYMVYGNGDNSADMPLSFVMQFLADQDADDMETSPYAEWYGDFVLTFTGIESGSFTADGCYLAGHYGSFGWVKVPVDGMLIEEGVRYPVMLGVGMGQKYDYICSGVEDFKCALYLTPKILEANPNIQVKLELAVVDNSKGSDAAASALINNEKVYSVTDYEYDAEDFVVKNYVAQVGEEKFETVAAALAYAKEQGITDLVITIIGENDASTEDTFDLAYGTAFESVTIKQDNGGKVYYLAGIYTGDRTASGGQFVLDGVNITSTSNIWFECDVVLKNNSVLTRTDDSKNFVFYGQLIIEPGSKFVSQIDDVMAGSLIVDGGKTDGTYSAEPDYKSIFVDVRNGQTLTLKNGAYALLNSANEIGSLTLNGAAVVTDSKLEVFNNIVMGANSSLTVNKNSQVIANAITGNGVIIIDATEMTADSADVIDADVSGFTGTVEVVNNDGLKAKIVDGKLVLYVPVYVAQIGDVEYETLSQAVAAVEDGGTITLICDITIDETTRMSSGGDWYEGLYYVGDKSFTIDLNGKTLTQDGSVNDYLMLFKNDGTKANTITIKNGTVDAGTSAYCAICTSSGSTQQITVNLENVKVIGNNSNGSVIKVRGGTVLNVKNDTVITGKNSYLGIECIASTTNIYDGAEIYMNGTSSYNGCLAGVGSGGTINVYGGYGKGVKGGFIAMTSGGTINISGGEWIANTDGTVGNNSNVYVLTAQNNKYESGYVGASIINVTGGTFRGGMDAWILNDATVEKAELNISGGNFNANPTAYLKAGYVAKATNGVYTVAKAVAQIGNTYYATLQDAFKAAKAGDTVTIFEGTYAMGDFGVPAGVTVVGEGNVTLEGTLTGSLENITLKNLYIKGGNAQRWAYAKGNLVFENVTFEATSVYALHFDGITEGATLLYKDCTIIGWTAMSGSPASCVFDGCTIKDNGAYGVIRTYFDATIKNCTFDVDGANPNDVYQDGIHAVGATIKVNNSRNANGDIKEILNISNESKIYVDDVLVLAPVVATIGDVEYFTLQDAVNVGGNITLLRDVTEVIQIPDGKTVNLDMNGKTLTGSILAPNAQLTINGGWIVNNDKRVSAIEINAGTLVLNNVHVASARHGVRIDGAVTATIGGDADHIVIQSAIGDGTGTYHAVNVSGAANVTIKNCSFIGSRGTVADSGAAVNVQTGATVTIEGGKFSGGKNHTLAADGTLTVKGGTFDQDPSAYCAFGYMVVAGDDGYRVIRGFKVATKTELNAALSAAQDGDTIILTADIDYGTDQLKVEKPIILDLGGNTLTTRNAWGGMSVKNNPTIKNGTIVHASNTAAIKVWNATAFEDLVIDVQGKGDANKTIGGIVLQSGSTTRVGSIKNVTIKGAALTNGIETYNCGDADENVIGSMENVTIDANGTAMLISAPVGTATGCTFDGGVKGIELWIKGTYSASLNLVDCDVVGRVDVHDEHANNVTNNGTLTLTTDADTTGVTTETVTLTINHAEESQVKGEVLETIIETAKAKVNGTYYATLAKAIAAAQNGDVITLLADCDEDVTVVQAPDKAITIDGAGKIMTGTITVDGKSAAYATAGLTIKNVKFDATNISKDASINLGGSNSIRYTSNVTVTGCTFTGTGNTKAAIKNYTGGCKNLTVTDCTATGVHSLIQVKGIDGLKVTNVTVNGKNGIAVGTSTNVVIDNANITATGYGVRADGEGAYSMTVKNSTITANDPIVVRKNTADGYQLHVEGNTLTGNNANGYKVTFTAGDDGEYVTPNVSVKLSGTDVEDVFPAFAAKIGDLYYASLQAAYAAAEAGDEIVMLAPAVVAAGETLTLDKAVTITYTSNVPGEDMITNKGNLVIDGATLVYTNTDTTASNVTVSTISCEPGSTLEVKSGVVKNDSANNAAKGIYAYAIDLLTNGNLGEVSATISGGEVISTNYMAIRQFNNGEACKNTLIISDGYVYGAKRAVQVHLNNNAAYTTISGGKIEGGDYALCFLTTSENLSVIGGEFIGNVWYSGTAGFISGGTFDAPVDEAYCAEGYIPTANGDGTYGVKVGQYVAQIGDKKYETLAEAIAAAQPGDEVKILVAGTYALSTSGKNITITGAVDGVVFEGMGAKNMGGASVTFNNVTFNWTNANYTGLQHCGDMEYNDCTINGQPFLYGTSEIFNNCTFNQISSDAYNVWTYGAKNVEFNGCTFNSAGKSVLIYSEQADLVNNVTVTNSTFNASAAVDGKAAIEMDSSLTSGINLTIDGATTATGFGSGNVSGNSLWNNKKGNNTDANNDITVVVGGETVLAPVTFVAQVNDGAKYESLQAAIEAAQSGETVTLIADIEITEPVVVSGKTLILDLGTYTILDKCTDVLTSSDDVWALIELENSANLTITGNGTIKCNYTNVAGGWTGMAYAINVDKTSTLTVNSGNIINGNGGIQALGTVTVNGGTFVSHNGGTCIMALYGDANVTVNGGTFKDSVEESDVYTGSGAVWSGFGATVVINDGTFDFAADPEHGNVVWTLFPAQNAIAGYGENANMTVTGGTFYNFNPETDVIVDYSASAGFTFGSVVGEGYMAVEGENNAYSVVVDPAYGKVAFITNAEGNVSYYETLQAAINAAKAGETITFLADITENVTVNKSLTIDGAGKKYTGNIAVKGSTVAVTVKNVNFVDGTGYAITTETIKSITVENCTVTNYGYGFLYAKRSTPSVVVKNVTVTGGNYGFHWVYGTTATFENVTMTNVTYGIYAQNYANKTMTLKDCDISSIAIWERDGYAGVQNFKFEGANTVAALSTSQYAKYDLAKTDATLTAPENDNVTTSLEGYTVKYVDGTYKVVKMVAKIDATGEIFGSVQEAINAAQPGDIVVVLKDIDLAEVEMQKVDGYDTYFLVEGKDITINLNGKTISGAYIGSFLVGVFSTDNNGKLTLTGNGTVDVTATGKVYSLIVAYNDGSSITIENGTYTLDKASDNLIYYGGHTDAEVIVKGGTFTLGNVGEGENGKPWIFNVLGAGDHHVLITGGTFNANINRQHWSNEAVVDKTCYVVEDNGTWTVKEGAVAYVATGMLTGPYFYRKDVGYATIEEAIKAAVDYKDGNITLLTDVQLAQDVEISIPGIILNTNGYTFDDNGHKITLTEADATLTAPEGLTVESKLETYYVTYEGGTYSLALYVAQNVNTGKYYATVNEALAVANSGETVVLLVDGETEAMLMVRAGVTLNLNGHTVAAGNVFSFGNIIDNDGTTDGLGGIIISNDRTQAFVQLQKGNTYMPLYDTTYGCYRFYTYSVTLGRWEVPSETSVRFKFNLRLSSKHAYTLLADAANSGVEITARLRIAGMEQEIAYKLTNEFVKRYAEDALAQIEAGTQEPNTVTKVMKLTLSGLGSLASGTTITFIADVESETGVHYEHNVQNAERNIYTTP